MDSSDRARFAEAREELFQILDDDLMRNVPVVIIANKQDLPNAVTPAEMIDALQLRKLSGHKWHIQGACATEGKGICESLEDVSKLVSEFKASRR